VKLLQLPTISYDVITLMTGVKSPSFFDIFRTDAEKTARRYSGTSEIQVPGRCNISNVLIEDKNRTLTIGHKIQKLQIDNIVLHGVIPLDQQEDVFECAIDYFEQQEE